MDRFRNLVGLSMEPCPGFNVLSGDNGQGKTNLVEAIYMVARLRSFRQARLADLVRHGETRAFIGARVVWPGITREVLVELGHKGKRVRVDGKGIESIGDHCARFRVVLFTPEDVDLPRASPAQRRRFLDRAIFNHDPSFLAHAAAFTQVLRRRAKVLRAHGPAELLDAYDSTLAREGAAVACARRDFVLESRERFRRILREVAGKRPMDGDLSYRSTVPLVQEGAGVDEVAAAYHRSLQGRRTRDLAAGRTTVGPHLDDLVLTLDGRPIKTHGSQGQHRIFVLAMKITEIESLRQAGGTSPILLLDDIGSELDHQRRDSLFEYLSGLDGQVFITTTDPNLVRIPGDRRDFVLKGGRIWNAS